MTEPDYAADSFHFDAAGQEQPNCDRDGHDWISRGDSKDLWRECWLCGRVEDDPS